MQISAAAMLTAILVASVQLYTSNAALASSLAAQWKTNAARSLEAQGLPDPKCHTGVVALKEAGKPQVCCAGYCGECSDYPTCKSVRGQNSTYACCKTEVYERRCGNAPANVCLKSCSESVPPCIMEDGVVFKKVDPAMRHAGSDCNKAVPDWRHKAQAAMNPPDAGSKPLSEPMPDAGSKPLSEPMPDAGSKPLSEPM